MEAAEWQACLSPYPVKLIEPCQSARGRSSAAAHPKYALWLILSAFPMPWN